MKIKNNSQRFQNSQPVFCLRLINIRISRYLCHVNHLAASRCHCCNKSKKFQRINRIRQFFYITLNISGYITTIKNMAVTICSTYRRRHRPFVNAFKNTSRINLHSAFFSLNQGIHLHNERRHLNTSNFCLRQRGKGKNRYSASQGLLHASI